MPFPAIHVDAALDSDPFDNTPTYTNIGGKAMSFSTQRGRSFELDAVNPGTLSATFLNVDRNLDPTYAAGDYYGKLTPNRLIRMHAIWDGTPYYFWTGFADNWPQVADDKSNRFAQATLNATDAFKWLGRTGSMSPRRPWIVGDPHLGKVGSAVVGGILKFFEVESCKDRIGRILDLWPFPAAMRDLDVGNTDLCIDTVEDPNQTAAQYLERIRASEAGRVFVSASGRVTFWARDHWVTETTQNTSQITLTDQHPGVGFDSLTLDPADERYVRNQIVRQRSDWATAIVAQDNDSTIAYGIIPDSVTNILTNDITQVQAQVAWELAKYKDPRERISSITINPLSDPDTLFPIVLGLEIGDRITVSRTIANVGDPFEADYWIEAISHSAAADLSWSTTWSLSPVDTDTY